MQSTSCDFMTLSVFLYTSCKVKENSTPLICRAFIHRQQVPYQLRLLIQQLHINIFEYLKTIQTGDFFSLHIVEFKSNYQSTNVWKSWPLWGKQENVHQNSCYVAISLSHSSVTKIGSLDFGMTKNKCGPFFLRKIFTKPIN